MMMDDDIDVIRIYKNFVPTQNIVEIRWKCDDPTEFKPSDDLYDKQQDGIPEDFGKKDPVTTFQPVLYCIVCQTEMSSIKTLGLHCEGTDHQKQVSRKHNEERLQEARIQVIEGDLEREWNKQNPNAGRPVHGRKFLISYLEDRRQRNTPIYFCCLEECKTFRGNVWDTLRHVNSRTHLDASASHPATEKNPMTVADNPRCYKEAKDGKIPESFWLYKSRALPIAREVKQERQKAPSPPREQEPRVLSPTYNCGMSTVGGGPGRVTDMHADPNVEDFDRKMGDFLMAALKHKLDQLKRNPKAADGIFKQLYPAVKKHQKVEHLKKGQPMETIRFNKQIGEKIDGLVEVYLQDNLP